MSKLSQIIATTFFALAAGAAGAASTAPATKEDKVNEDLLAFIKS